MDPKVLAPGRVRGLDFHLMSKPSGATCNLDCDYCFFLSKDQLYPGVRPRMDRGTHESYIAGLLRAQAGLDEVTVAYQGGEPTLMGIEFFVESLQLQRRYATPGKSVVTTIQTNGTLLDDTWGEFLAENGILVGISVDGPRARHDAFRVDRGGKPTFDRVMRGVDVLRRHGVDWNVLTTVNAANDQHGLEVYRFLRDDLGAAFIQLIPIVERVTPDLLAQAEAGWGARSSDRPLYVQAGDCVTSRSTTGERYGQFLVDVFDEWVRHDVGDVFVQVFDTALAHWLGLDQAGMCVHARTCGTALALEHNGDVYSCDHYVEPDSLVGNLNTRPLLELVTSDRQHAFGQAKLDTLPRQCLDCDVRFACNGGCPKDRFQRTSSGDAGLNYLCAGYQRFFRHADAPMRFMADLVRQGRDADGVRDWVRRRDAAQQRQQHPSHPDHRAATAAH